MRLAAAAMSVRTSGSGISRLDGRIEIGLDPVGLDIAPRDDAGQQLRHAMTLRDRERARIAAVVEPVAPGPPGRRALDAEEVAVGYEPRHR